MFIIHASVFSQVIELQLGLNRAWGILSGGRSRAQGASETWAYKS
jgi:hypothetical protein